MRAGVVGDVIAVVELEHGERRQAFGLDAARRADLDVGGGAEGPPGGGGGVGHRSGTSGGNGAAASLAREQRPGGERRRRSDAGGLIHCGESRCAPG